MCNKHVHKTMTRHLNPALGVRMKKLCLDMYLEHFGGGALEQLDVAGSDALFVFRQSVGDVVVAGKQHERVSSRSAVCLVHEQHSVLAVQNAHRRTALTEERQLKQFDTHTHTHTHPFNGPFSELKRSARVQIAAATLSGNSLTQTVHTHRSSVHQAAKSVAALLRVPKVTAGRAESNGSLQPGL